MNTWAVTGGTRYEWDGKQLLDEYGDPVDVQRMADLAATDGYVETGLATWRAVDPGDEVAMFFLAVEASARLSGQDPTIEGDPPEGDPGEPEPVAGPGDEVLTGVLNALVDDGTLTEEQADAVAAVNGT